MRSDPSSSPKRARVMQVVTGLGTGGAERLVHDFARRVDPERFEMTVVSLDDASGRFAGLLREAGIEVLGLDRWRRSVRWCARGLARVVDELRPDLLHAHLHHANIAARWVARDRPRLPVLTTAHVAEQRFRPWHFRQNASTARWGHAEICVSRTVLEHQVARTGLPRHFFRLLFNRVETGRFRPARPGEAGPRVVAVGALRPLQKGFDVLLEAWARVVRELPEATLTIAGEGPERAAFERRAAALPDGGRSVELPGDCSDVPGLLESAGLFCVPSRWEGLPLVGMEAMAAGLPVVATDIGSWREIVDEGVHGRLVPVGDAAALAEALVALLKDPAQRERMGAASLERARERFDFAQSVAQLEALYDETLRLRDGEPALAGIEPWANPERRSP